ncbi:hypothetical protein DICPUDRAFT_147598 [Dictyostelium purpureum]|uniref:MARVEL domain-containing protein n=1 Tax=Dictyostelium purpureum TaxID=5786 RepID=F0Z8X1_DICPU|nr:uncharacterized protein DICPUDRAFT_147598 [Dictyostelium purpureum]EGC39650.1 hypothetical protein DICPUDRAFT_147598 [Dictyostelium purpureum]|eukprot:XP_003283871.1 hypothetical protein DICPUDRAFT_147598 [Dictyostelium purpureum]
MKFYSVVSAIIFLVAWILILLSFFKTWYYFEITQPIDEYNTVKYSFGIGKVKTHDYHNSTANSNLDTIKFFKQFGIGEVRYNEFLSASVGFAIISWVICMVQFALCVLDVIGKTSNIGRFLGIIVLIFTMLSLSIFTGFKSSLHKACLQSKVNNCDSGALKGLWSSSFVGENDYSEWGYGDGWIYMIAAFVLSFAGAIYNILFFNKNREDD